MATSYITDRDHLASLLGAKTLEAAERALALEDIGPVIASQNALADGYVQAQLSLPVSAEAQAQVAPIVAELVFTALYVNSTNEQITKRRDAALRTLRDIAAGTLKLAAPAPVDNPDTPEDESTGIASGSASRQLTSWVLYEQE